MTQDLDGLKNFLETYMKGVVLEEKTTHIEMRCREDLVSRVISLVHKFGYWASEIQHVEEAVTT